MAIREASVEDEGQELQRTCREIDVEQVVACGGAMIDLRQSA